MDVLLPEVLVGLKDNNNELVAGTLHALGDLIPLLGADTVMGTPTPRKQIFTDAQPRVGRCDTMTLCILRVVCFLISRMTAVDYIL